MPVSLTVRRQVSGLSLCLPVPVECRNMNVPAGNTYLSIVGAKSGQPRRSEDAEGDDGSGARGRRRARELEMLGAGDGRASG